MKTTSIQKSLFWIFLPALILLSSYFLYHTISPHHSRYIRACKLSSSEEYEKSIKLLIKLIKSDTANARAYRTLAEVYNLKNDLNEGILCYDKLAQEMPYNYLVDYGRGCLYQMFKEYHKADLEYKKFIILVPSYSLLYRDIIDNFLQSNKLDEADSIFSSLAIKDTNNSFINYALGYISMKQNQWEKAISFLDKSLAYNNNLLHIYHLKGSIFFSIGQYDKMIEVSKAGLAISKAKKDFRHQAILTGNIGLALCYTGNYEESTSYLKKAIKLSEKIGLKSEEVRDALNLGLVYRSTSDYEMSLRYFEKSLKGAKQINDQYHEGLNYLNIGIVYQMMGKFSLSLDNIKKSYAIADKISDNYTKLWDLFNLGLVSGYLSDYDNALGYHQQMFEIAILTGNRFAEGRSYCGTGLVYWNQGYYAKALDYEEKGLVIATEIGDSEGESWTLGNIAIIYNDIGNYSKALEYYTKALEVSEKIGAKAEVARHLGNIGCTQLLLNNYSSAMDYFQQSLRMNKEIGNQQEIGSAYGNLGDLMIRMGNYIKAEEYLKQSLKISKETGAKRVIAYQLINLGFLKYNQADYKTSLDFFSEALKYARSTGELAIHWQAQTGMAMVLEKQNKPEQALEHYFLAIEKIEKVQRELPVEEYKSDFFGEHINVYEGTVDILASMHNQFPQKNFDKLAFNYAERAKARSFLENLVASKADVKSGVDPELKQKEEDILRNISVVQKELFTTKLTKDDRKKLQLELTNYDDSFEKITREIREKNTKYATLYYPESYDVAKIQHEILQNDESILEFSLGEKCSFLWLISRDNFQLFKLPGKESIEKAVQEYITTIEQPVGVSNPFSNHIAKGYDVYNMILKQCMQGIKKGNHIIVVADGILYYLPFESLVTKKDDANGSPHYLVEDFTFSYSPSSTSMAYYNKNQSDGSLQKQLLAFGNPEFNQTFDASLTRGRSSNTQKLRILREKEEDEKLKSLYENDGFHFSSLPYSGDEVTAIAGLFPKGESVIHLQSDASEESLKKEALDNYKYIHFATHGFIEEAVPFRSGIVLSLNEASTEDGILQINEILNLKLNADMVALSACQTARGKLYQGEGIVGIARAFFYAGSSSVTVCLWNINDRTTSGFMKDFYSGLVNGKDKKDALQEAKLTMIRSKIPTYRHPYYWAPFIVIGNYR